MHAVSPNLERIATVIYELNPLISIEALDYTERYRVTLDLPLV